MKKEKVIISAVVAVVLIAVIGINNLINRPAKYNPEETEKYTVTYAEPETGDLKIDSSATTYQKIGESGNLELYINPSIPAIQVKNKDTGKIWSSLPVGMEDKKSGVGQLCSVVYINSQSDNTGVVNNTTTSCNIDYSGLKNGIAVNLEFPDQTIKISLQLWLEEGRLWLRIPMDDISENEPFRVLSIDALPFFGSVGKIDDGYILFPDGAGALYPLNNVNGTSPLTLDVYSDRVADIDKVIKDTEEMLYGAMLPVYGIKTGNDSVVAYMAAGAESSAVTLGPNGYVLPYSRVYGTSIYRKVTEIPTDAGISTFEADASIRTEDFSICYQFQSGDKANYSGMAEAVKNLMDEYQLLPKSDMKKTSLKLDILMGAMESTMVGNSYQRVTSAKQVNEILNDLQLGTNGTTALLLGWQSHGYGVYPDTGKAASSIGRLSSIKQPDNAEVYLDYRTVLAIEGQKGASSRRDAIRNSRLVTILSNDKTTYLVNANAQLNAFKKIKNKLLLKNLSGISVSGIGTILYDDYNSIYTMTRLQAKNSFAEIMNTVKEEKNLIVGKANAYAFKYADWLSDLPDDASGYPLLKEQVPFYYLVVSGKAPYSMSTAGNLAADFRVTKLKWIEYGAVPYFLVSNDGSEKLTNTPAKTFFSIEYKNEKEKITETVEEFDKIRIEDGCSVLVSHNKLADGVYKSVFENGNFAIVNYNETEYSADGNTVPALGYITGKVAAK